MPGLHSVSGRPSFQKPEAERAERRRAGCQAWGCSIQRFSKQGGTSLGWCPVIFDHFARCGAFCFHFWVPYIPGSEDVSGHCTDTQPVTGSAELRTTGSCSRSARGRLLGKRGWVGGPHSSPHPHNPLGRGLFLQFYRCRKLQLRKVGQAARGHHGAVAERGSDPRGICFLLPCGPKQWRGTEHLFQRVHKAPPA